MILFAVRVFDYSVRDGPVKAGSLLYKQQSIEETCISIAWPISQISNIA